MSSDDFRIEVLHDKHHDCVRIFIYDTNLMGGFKLTPEQAEEIGRIGRMARAYRESQIEQ